MKRLKLVAATTGTLLALSVLATAAVAEVKLPDISVTLSGGTYPLHIVGSIGGRTNASTLSGVALEGKGATLLLLLGELSALGTFTWDYTNVLDPFNGNQCNTLGDAAGVVLVPGEFHLVQINLNPLMVGLLYLISFTEIRCGGTIILLRGRMLSTVVGIGNEGTELGGLGVTLVGKEGKQELSEYYNTGGTRIKAELELEPGSGFVDADANIEGELGASVLGSQMYVITGR
jgi:hypothetical protein